MKSKSGVRTDSQGRIVLRKLKDFRDNMYKKTYLRKVTGSDSIADSLDYVTGIAKETYYDESKEVLEAFHRVLFRIGSRILSRIGHEPQKSEREEQKDSSKFHKLCGIKNRYWRKILKIEEK